MIQRFHIWCPAEGEEQSDGRERGAYSFEDAANDYVESLWHEEPFEEPMVVKVANVLGEVKTFTVYPEPTMTFTAYEQ